MRANSHQVGGSHYKSGYQHWDLVVDLGLGYFEGQITKYVARHRKKHGLSDLNKARHFIDKMIESANCIDAPVVDAQGKLLLQSFFEKNKLSSLEGSIITLVSCWGGSHSMLENARSILDELIDESTPL